MERNLKADRPADPVFLSAVPALSAMLVQQLCTLTDVLTAGRFLGQEPLAAVCAAGPAALLVTGLCAAVISSSVSRAAGERRRAADAGYLTAVLAAVLTAGGCLFSRQVPGETGRTVLVLSAAVPFLCLFCLTSALLRARGDAGTPLCILVLTPVVNGLLDLLLVRMGTVGTALATLLAWAAAGTVCSVRVLRRMPPPGPGDLKPDRKILTSLCAGGLYPAVLFSAAAAGTAAVQSAAAPAGAAAVLAETAVCLCALCAAVSAGHPAGRGRLRILPVLTAAAALGAGLHAAAPALSAWSADMPEDVICRTVRGAALFLPACALMHLLRCSLLAGGHRLPVVLSFAGEAGTLILTAAVLIPSFGTAALPLSAPLCWTGGTAALIPAVRRSGRRPEQGVKPPVLERYGKVPGTALSGRRAPLLKLRIFGVRT